MLDLVGEDNVMFDKRKHVRMKDDLGIAVSISMLLTAALTTLLPEIAFRGFGFRMIVVIERRR